jgi:hypothetical protein
MCFFIQESWSWDLFLSHSFWSCTLLGFVFACFCCGSLGALLPGTKVTLADVRIVDGVAMLGDAAHVVRVCGRIEEMARAHQMKAEAASLRHRMFRAALADDEEPPPPFTLLEVAKKCGEYASVFSAALILCLQNHAF